MDRRIRKTEDQILHATLRLLNKEPMNSLTVKQICIEANVSRSTFYLHYTEPRDVVEQLYNEVAVTLTNILDNFDFSSNSLDAEKLLEDIFDEVEMYKDYFAVLLTTGYHSDFRRRLKKILEDKILNDNAYRFRNLQEFGYYVDFIISGLVECICDNIEDFFDEKAKNLLFMHLKNMLTRLASI
ncbi:MAG: TetR/AcrR family transcriptional regulator [Clostridia bacterium]|nr:TetR/AcrR family transcriptional regulator [Clostridia bacterium]